MKKVLIYIVLFLIVVFLSSVGIGIAIIIDFFYHNHHDYFLISPLAAFFTIILSIYISISLHELCHLIGYKLKKYDFRLFYIFPFCIVKEEEKYHLSLSFNWILGIGGIVIPKLPKIKSKNEINNVINVMRFSLILAPLISLLYGALSLVILTNIDYLNLSIKPFFFFFTFSNILTSLYITGMSSINFGGIIGDYAAFLLLKKSPHYSLIQVYNEYILQEESIKKYVRDNNLFTDTIIELLSNKNNDKLDSNTIYLIDIVIIELLVSEKKEINEYISSMINKIFSNNIADLKDKLKFESYSRLFCHLIMYIYLYISKEKAIKYLNEYKTELSKSQSSVYGIKQCESLIKNTNFNEKIIISSLDSLLRNLPNYFHDEKELNSLGIKQRGDHSW